MRTSTVGFNSAILVTAMFFLSAQVALPDSWARAQVVQYTGFEAEEGWEAGYSICGPEFADTCSYPVTDVCVPNDHMANQNCCEADPNVDTGWFMADRFFTIPVQHCNEPHIETANPFSGSQHLRFEPDPDATGPAIAITPAAAPQPPMRTVVSFELAGSMGFFGFLDELSYVQFAIDRNGDGYQNVTLDFDPVRMAARYCRGGQVIYSGAFLPGEFAWHHALFWTSGVSDVDDYSVTIGGGPPTTCAFMGTTSECGPGPCVALNAVAIDGVPIPPSNEIYVRPGDRLETEILISGWGSVLETVQAYQLELLLWFGAAMGPSGTVLPVGWHAPLYSSCVSNNDCPDAYPICSPVYDQCVGPGHDPKQGAFIDTTHPAFMFRGLETIAVVDTLTPQYRYLGIGVEPNLAVPDPGFPVYAGTLLLDVSHDACGAFMFPFRAPPTTYLQGPYSVPPLPSIFPEARSLIVRVCEDDGLFCNGLESCASGTCVITPPPDCDDGNDCTADSCDEAADACAHIAVCGACCDSWIGECEDAVAEADCDCQSCVWSGAAECADIECDAEFVAIPTVSQWGLIVLTLVLLTGAKLAFGRLRPMPSV